ncbi:hypothetical protein [Silvimonas amylolytica]|uniref:RDD family protein n=1 Tax=Silvimonas amylolytica TaxID=449663 RepID=A0ABQ2PG84_9NEIS|nr:hypothetical protein [Silvimonas amylolytica]GGP24437.1 hypothetical protein GCM10010971_02560 [Silvimonas amylolytica]
MDRGLLYYVIDGFIAMDVLYAVLLAVYIARIFMKKTVLTNPALLKNVRIDFKAGDPVARILWPVQCIVFAQAFLLLFFVIKNRLHH